MNTATLRRILNAEAREAGAGSGRLTAELLVERTRDTAHPLHRFIWNESDAEAAHQRRLDLARALIRRVTLDVEVNEVTLRVPFMVRDSTQPEGVGGYRETLRIRSDREAARETLVRELTALAAIRTRVLSLAMVLDLEDEARQAMGAMDEFSMLVREAKPARRAKARRE